MNIKLQKKLVADVNYQCKKLYPNTFVQRFLSLTIIIGCLFLSQLFVACSGSTSGTDPDKGMLEITVTTVGADTDPNGYTFSVQGAGTFETGANDVYTFSNISPGSYQVELTEFSAHCSPTTPNPQTVQITADETTVISFEINCSAILRNKIIFNSNHEGGVTIYSTSPDNPEKNRIPQFNVSNVWRPAISPDGTKIAFVSSAQGFQLQQIWVMDADGTNFENITKDNNAHSEFPSWSPDGTRIAYHRYAPNGEGDIYIMDADGSNRTNITNSATGDWYPDWHPNGDRIAFHTIADGQMYISTINVDGSGRQELLRGEGLLFRNPSWSPDGQKIAFQSNLESQTWEIYVADANGSNPVNLTKYAVSGRQHRLVTWSPDGSKIAFDSNRDGADNTYDIFVMNANGSNLTNLTNNMNSSSVFPFWSPVE